MASQTFLDGTDPVLVCACNRSFSSSGALNKHLASCQRSKKRLSHALAAAKESWVPKKRQRIRASDLSVANTGERAGRLHGVVDGDALEYNTLCQATCSVQSPEVAFEPQSIPTPADDPNVLIATDDLDKSIAERKPKRTIIPTAKVRDSLPEPAPIVSPVSFTPSPGLPVSSNQLTPTVIVFRTEKNVFSIFRRYASTRHPDYDPEEATGLRDLCDGLLSDAISPTMTHYPYPNASSFLLGDWFWNSGHQKSVADFRRLLDIVGSEEFKPRDLQNVNWKIIDKILGQNDFDGGKWEWEDEDAGWKCSPVTISVPFPKGSKIPGVQSYTGNFYHRSLLSVIREKIKDNRHFHFEPFESFWHPPRSDKSIRIYSEVYSSPAFQEAHANLQNSSPEPECSLPRVVVAMMFWSDSTHPTQFGDAKLWPLYFFVGNESKYRRAKPTCHCCSHLAYFVNLPDSFKDFAQHFAGGKGPSDELMSHCHREFLHAQWNILLNQDFMEAYKHGIVETCYDGKSRRFFPRFFSYSADYKEKVLWTTVRDLGLHPCPRCLIPLAAARELGTLEDRRKRIALTRTDSTERRDAVKRARKYIYNEPYLGVKSAAVERLLKDQSLHPIESAFSEKLADLGVNVFQWFLPDFMHEVELGRWKDVYIHLLRILTSVNPALINEVDRRYRAIPTFGKDTIRRFARNSSEMRKMTARDWEDLLQCAIPVFEGLLPEPHNRNILRFLYVFAHWHSLAKLKLHTELTLTSLDKLTTDLGHEFRFFEDKTSKEFVTKELPRERDSRVRLAARAKAQKADLRPSSTVSHEPPTVSQALGAQSSSFVPNPTQTVETQFNTPFPTVAFSAAVDPKVASDSSAPENSSGPPTRQKTAARSSEREPKFKSFNNLTYKLHSFGDYVETIRRYGTTDSYSTELGELEHRNPKSMYRRTNRKEYIPQMVAIERREARLRRLRQSTSTNQEMPQDPIITSTPESHHHIATSQNDGMEIRAFLKENASDPALKDFRLLLREHLMPRIQKVHNMERLENPEFFSDGFSDGHGLPGIHTSPLQEEMSTDHVVIKNDKIFKHSILRVNYTTYDIRRRQDVVNPRTSHCDILMLADQTQTLLGGHHYRYGRVIGVFHANVSYTGIDAIDYRARRIEFLWVRWFHTLEPCKSWRACELDRLTFMPLNCDGAFGFVDPAHVLRACHALPRFICGMLHPDGIGMSRSAQDGQDYREYYANRFVDRDMIMRYYWGLAPGHVYTHGFSVVGEDYSTTDQSRNDQSIGDDSRGVQFVGQCFPLPDQSESVDVITATLSEDNIWHEDDDPADDVRMNDEDSENDEEVLAWHEMYGN